MEKWVPPYKVKSRTPIRMALFGLGVAFLLCVPVMFVAGTGNPWVAAMVLLCLAFACGAPAVFARDVVLERFWSYISWLSRG